MKNNREIEVKFKIANHGVIRKILIKNKAQFIGRAFEKTVRFDTPRGALQKDCKFLRLRSGFKNVITFKRKIKNNRFKEREEIELEISDLKKMKLILESLGFTRVLIMEKYREKWRLQDVEIVLDTLPMGKFIEIEGSKKSIVAAVKMLNLNFRNRIISSYWDIWKEYSRAAKINGEDIVFRFKNSRKFR